MTDNKLRIDIIPRDLYYHEVAYVRELERRIEVLEAALEHIEALCFEAISYGHTDINRVLSAIARAALDKDAGK